MNDVDKSFEINQRRQAQQVQEQLDKAAAAYEVLVPHISDPDIMEQLEALGLPSSLPTLMKAASLLEKGVFIQIPATDLIALMPLVPFPERDQVREGTWEQLGWAGR